jgi:UDP-N-acetylglucosamine--N-acetylmuramyl-(pentapeptide) pyrophosphoryl-undecaprenol N-acetylglucosamine transferase
MSTYLMAAGGTGGHVIPALAVARELRRRGHEVFFVGTDRGMEARLAPAERFDLERIEIGGLKNVGAKRLLTTLWQLPLAIVVAGRIIERRKPVGVFSMGGYAAGPPVLAAFRRKLPVVVMEPNAVPGFTNRKIGRFVARALISFPDTAIYFPNGRTEMTGLPVRQEFFALSAKRRSPRFGLLVTGGSQGSRTLNNAARESWPLFRNAKFPIEFTLQTGRAQADELAREFSRSGLKGTVTAFIEDMPKAFGAADLVICRSGAGAVAEVAAAGKPSVLVPFPHAADQHQLRNAEAFERAGAARLVRDPEMTGEKLFAIVNELSADDGSLERMGAAARRFARPGAARRAAEILEEVSQTSNIR